MKKSIFLLILLVFVSSFVSASDLEILSTSSYINQIGYLNIVGEVKNTSESPYNFIQLVASFYDNNDKLIDSGTTYALLETIVPGQIAPFKISIKNKESIKKYGIQVQADKGGDKPRNLEILDSSSSVNQIGYLIVNGQVKNNEDEAVEFVQIIVTFYDENGTVVDVATTYSSIDKIQPGNTSPFKISIKNKAAIDNYKLQVQ